MTYQLGNAKVWDGAAWVDALGGVNPMIFPFNSGFNQTNPLGTAALGPLTTLTANTSAHTFGAWTELQASSIEETSGIMLITTNFNTSAVATGSIIDIGVGAAGGETSLMQIPVGSHSGYTTIIPIRIAAGSRIAARIQSVVTGGKTGVVAFSTMPVISNFQSATSVDVYGTDLATSRGISVPTANTFEEVTPSTTRPYRAILVVWSASNDTMTNNAFIFQLGIGAAGSETVLGYGRARHSNSELVATDQGNFPFFYAGNIPQGSRISVQHAGGPNQLDVCVIGIPYP